MEDSVMDTMNSSEVNAVWSTLTLSTTKAPAVRPDMNIFLEHRIRTDLNLYAAPTVIIVGTLGNILSFAVLQTKSFRQSSIGFVLSALAILDTCILNTGLLRQWIKVLNPTLDVRNFSDAGCRIHTFLCYCLPHLSSWTLVLLTIERLILVANPLKARQICTRCKVSMVWMFTAIACILLNCHFFWTFKLLSYEARGRTSTYCYFDQAYRVFWRKYWTWIDFTFLSFLPFLVIFPANIAIMMKIAQARQLRRQCSNVAEHAPQERSAQSTTAMLVCVSLVFLLLTTPNVVFFIGLEYWLEGQQKNYHLEAKLGLGYTISNLMFYTNSGINFLLYCVMGSQFRRALVKLVMKGRPHLSRIKTSHTSSSTKQTLLPLTPAPQNNIQMHPLKMESTAEG